MIKIRSNRIPISGNTCHRNFYAPLLCESAHVCRNRIRKRGRPNSAWRACGSHDGPRDWMSKSELHNAWVTGTRRFSRFETDESISKRRKQKKKGKDPSQGSLGIFLTVNSILRIVEDEIARKQESHNRYEILKILNKYLSDLWIFLKSLDFDLL